MLNKTSADAVIKTENKMNVSIIDVGLSGLYD